MPVRLWVRAAVFMLAASLILGGPAAADTIRLKNGNVVTGRILEENDNEVRIDTGQLTLTFPRKNIDSVERGRVADFVLQKTEQALAEGQRLARQGEMQKARHVFESALQDLDLALKDLDPAPEDLLNLKERLDQARIETLPKDPANQKAEEIYSRALTHLDHLEYRKAYDLLKEAAQLAPDRADVLLRLAEAAVYLSVPSEAIQAYRTVLSLDARAYYDEAGTRLHKILQQRVQKLLAERRSDEAVDVYKEVILFAGSAPDKPVTVEEYLTRKASREEKKEEDLLMEVYRFADSSDLVDLAFAAVQRVQARNPRDETIQRLVAETRYLSEFKAKIDTGKVDEAAALAREASPEVVGSKRVAEKMQRLAGEHAARIEAQTLAARARAAFEAGRYGEAKDLASTLLRKFPASDSAAEAAQLSRDADFEVTVQEGLDAAEGLIDKGLYDGAEKEFALLAEFEAIDQSRQYSRLESLKERIPREKAADELWALARAGLDQEAYTSALERLEALERDYGDTRAGRRAKDWLADSRKRLQRETTRYRPTDVDFFSSLADPSAWRPGGEVSPAAAGEDVQKVSSVPEDRRLVAWGAFEQIMKTDLAGRVERRSQWLHVGLPLGLGVILLLVVLWVFARPGKGTLREAGEDSEDSEEGASGGNVVCRMCGQSVAPGTSSCPACGTPSSLTRIEMERALDESREANLDPWEFRARPRNLTDFEPHFERAKELAEKGMVNAAIEACRRALMEDPHRPSAYAFLADLYERHGRQEEAELCYREILLLEPTEIVVRRKIHRLSAYSGLSLDVGPVVIVLSSSAWWFLYWLAQGIEPVGWIVRALLAAAGAALTVVLWRRIQGKKKVEVPAPLHRGAELGTPLPKTALSWKEQNRQARTLAQTIREHTGIAVPVLTVWRVLAALALSALLLGALVGIAWFNHAPYVLLAWPAGVVLLVYALEIHPRVLTAHAVLRHLFEETFSPWVDPHRPFRPQGKGENAQGEFLIPRADRLPVRWALTPFPYSITRQGLLNSLQQALNRHWEFHRFYNKLRVVRDTVVPLPAGFRSAGLAALALVVLSIVGIIFSGSARYAERQGYRDAMTAGYQYLLEGNLAAARRYFQKAARQDPDRAAPLLYLAHTEASAGFDFAAERAFRAAAARARKIAAVHNDFGNFLQSKGRFHEAIGAYQAALKTDRDNADVLSNIASAFFKMNNYSRAVDFLLPALKSNPGHSRAHTTLGLALEALGDRERARKAYETALQVAPRQAYTQVARHRLELDLEAEDANPMRLEALDPARPADEPTTPSARPATNTTDSNEVPQEGAAARATGGAGGGAAD